MKHIINYLGALLAMVLIGTTFTACSDEDAESANVGLGIKTFFPTKVVTNQPMTINGSGFSGVTEIEFPGGTKVTNFEVVSNSMIKVNTPSGITSGGKIIVRTANDEAESRQSLTVGHTNVTGFSKQPGEAAVGGELITVFGSDLEFINSIELLDADSVPQLIDHQDFYRKGTSNLIFRVPLKNIYKGTFVGTLHTYDGQSIPMPELAYEPAADTGGGHWEVVKTTIWKNEDPAGNGAVSWSSQYRFSNENSSTGEEIYAIPMDQWELMKTQTFYLLLQANDPQVRVTTGWWSTTWTGGDFQPGNELLTDNGDGTWTLKIDLAGDPILGSIDVEHLLFTGDRFTPLEIYFAEEKWVEGGGHMELVKTSIWGNNDPAGNGAVSWSSQYRFSNENSSTGEEIYAIPMDIWEKMKTTTFYLDVQATDPQIRVTTGWWSTTWTGADFQPGNELLKDNGDGTWTLKIDLAGDPILNSIDVEHLLFTGDRFTPLEIYFAEEVWVEGGGNSSAKEVVIWEGDGSAGAVTWSSQYRFSNAERTTGEEIYAIPMDQWEIIKTSTFYLDLQATDPQIRVTTGWWSTTWTGADFQPGNELIKDNGDGTWTLEINLSGDPILDAMDVEHLLFTGDRFTPTKLYYYE